MKRIFLIFLIYFLGMGAYVAHAKLVHYTDENGKIHYVNPDFVKIPDKYLPQVRSQLEPPEENSAENTSDEKTPDSETPSQEQESMSESSDSMNTPYSPGNTDEMGETSDQNYDNYTPYVQPTPPPQEHFIPTVDLFISNDCLDCKDLEQALIANNIKYRKYDVTQTSYGKRIYQRQGGKLPIVHVGPKTFYTINVNDIKNILEQPTP